MKKCLLSIVLAGSASPLLAQTCAISSASLTAPTYDPFGAQLQVQGSVSFSCTRPPGNPRFPTTFLVGASGTNPRSMSNGTDTLGYSLLTGYAPCGGNWDGSTALQVANTAPNPTDNGTRTTPTMTATFCLQIPAGQTGSSPGTYTATPVLTITDSNGHNWLTGGVLNLIAPVAQGCAIVNSPSALTINYTAFGPAQSGNSLFRLRCTNRTPYSLSLDATSGTMLGLPYTLSLPAGGTGSGQPQTITITGTIPAGQAGACAGATCSQTQTRQLTVTY